MGYHGLDRLDGEFLSTVACPAHRQHAGDLVAQGEVLLAEDDQALEKRLAQRVGTDQLMPTTSNQQELAS